MRVIAYTQRCIASGNCVLTCSDLFEQRDSDGTVHVLNERPTVALLGKVRQAVELCPAQVFEIEDGVNEEELIVLENDQAI